MNRSFIGWLILCAAFVFIGAHINDTSDLIVLLKHTVYSIAGVFAVLMIGQALFPLDKVGRCFSNLAMFLAIAGFSIGVMSEVFQGLEFNFRIVLIVAGIGATLNLVGLGLSLGRAFVISLIVSAVLAAVAIWLIKASPIRIACFVTSSGGLVYSGWLLTTRVKGAYCSGV